MAIACVECEETGSDAFGELCQACNGEGHIRLDGCPRSYIGSEMTNAINIATVCENGILPITGGLLDQSGWFVDVMSVLRTEQNRIENERWEEARG